MRPNHRLRAFYLFVLLLAAGFIVAQAYACGAVEGELQALGAP